MKIKEKTENVRIVERKKHGKWKDSHMFFFILPVILTILFPVGIVFYLCGRFRPDAITFVYVHMLYLVACVFILYCFFLGILKLYRAKGERTRSEIIMIAAETSVPLIFVALLIAPQFFVGPEFCGLRQKALMLGLRDRVKSKVGIGAIQTWLQSLDNNDYDDSYDVLSPEELPELFRRLKDARARLLADENDKAKIRLYWGSGMVGHWGVEIGTKDMRIPSSDFGLNGELRLPLEPGVYAWIGD